MVSVGWAKSSIGSRFQHCLVGIAGSFAVVAYRAMDYWRPGLVLPRWTWPTDFAGAIAAFATAPIASFAVQQYLTAIVQLMTRTTMVAYRFHFQ